MVFSRLARKVGQWKPEKAGRLPHDAVVSDKRSRSVQSASREVNRVERPQRHEYVGKSNQKITFFLKSLIFRGFGKEL